MKVNNLIIPDKIISLFGIYDIHYNFFKRYDSYESLLFIYNFELLDVNNKNSIFPKLIYTKSDRYPAVSLELKYYIL